MATLTHVCIWSEDGWTKITAQEAARLHPGGTVSAHSGLFMCELCGQYVTLTDGYKNVRYFKHSAYEKSKDCPERTFGSSFFRLYDPQKHDLPIKIIVRDKNSFGFEIGFVRAPILDLRKDFSVVIGTGDAKTPAFEYSKRRLLHDGITYLPVGDEPSEKYTISFKNGTNGLHSFWPAVIAGIDPKGTLFEKSSGKKLPLDGDVEVKKDYYLLKLGAIPSRFNGVSIQQTASKRSGWKTWMLYTVSASDLTEGAARFFLNYHGRLTARPISLHPIWPPFVEGECIFKHNQNFSYILAEGNIEHVQAFPPASVRQIGQPGKQAQVYKIYNAGRQQLISSGRSRMLQYTYLWREPLDKEGSRPSVTVVDIDNKKIPRGAASSLPKKRMLRFKLEYDGELIVTKHGVVADVMKVDAGKFAEVEQLSFGTKIDVIVGLDTVWGIEFIENNEACASGEERLLLHITSARGSMITAPHALRNIYVGMGRYPHICQWIQKCIRSGEINEQSYRRLQNIYQREKM